MIELHVKMFTIETRQTDSKAGFPANAKHATNLRIQARNAMTTSFLDRPITAASDDGVYMPLAARCHAVRGRHARNF